MLFNPTLFILQCKLKSPRSENRGNAEKRTRPKRSGAERWVTYDRRGSIEPRLKSAFIARRISYLSFRNDIYQA